MTTHNSNIFVPPIVADGFEALEPIVAEQLLKDTLYDMRTSKLYTHGVVGSDDLANFYNGMSGVYDAHGSLAEEYRVLQPIAVLARCEDRVRVTLGSITHRLPKSAVTQPVHSRFESQETSSQGLGFSLLLLLGNTTISRVYDRDARGGPVEATAIIGRKYKSHYLDRAEWARDQDSGKYVVNRKPGFKVIAFGDDAIRALPEFDKYVAPVYGTYFR